MKVVASDSPDHTDAEALSEESGWARCSWWIRLRRCRVY